MITLKIRPPEPGVVAGGMFDDLPGTPWKAPPKGDYGGFAIPAFETVKHYDSDEVGEASFDSGEVELTVRVIGLTIDASGRHLRVVHFIGGEFEVLALLTEDMKSAHLSFRGSEIAFAEAAETLLAQNARAMAKHGSVRALRGEEGL